MKRFEGKVALITGASRGIGLGVAQRLVSEGARVVLTARNADVLAAAAASLGPEGTALWVAGKADDAAHRAEVLDLIGREFGALDHFVNNAGVNPAYGGGRGAGRRRQGPVHWPPRGWSWGQGY